MKTIKQLADELGVTKQAVRYRIEKLGIQDTLLLVESTYHLNAQQETQIRAAFEAGKSVKYSQEDSVKDSASTLHPSYHLLETQIAFLQEQLRVKDEQIAGLIGRLGEAQYLHADTKGMAMLPSSETTDAPPRRWWQRVLSRLR